MRMVEMIPETLKYLIPLAGTPVRCATEVEANGAALPEPTKEPAVDVEAAKLAEERKKVADEMDALIKDAPNRDTFDPDWFIPSEVLEEADNDLLNNLAVEVATNNNNPRGVARLIEHYSGGKKGITNLPANRRTPLYYALTYLIQVPGKYKLYAEGFDLSKGKPMEGAKK